MGKFENLENMIFGNWKVLYRAKDNMNGKKPVTMWRCKCLLCGNQQDVRANSLKSGRSTQCISCSHKNKIHYKRKNNEYVIENDYIIGTIKTGEKFYIDKECYDEVSKYFWSKTPNGYLYTRYNKEFIYMHRMIMKRELESSTEKENYIDHINHNKLDNRKCNLRVVSQSKNLMNRIPSNTFNTNGIYYSKNLHRYVARIFINNRRISLGSFECLEDAIKARKDAEEKYFGEYSYGNSMKYSMKNESRKDD